MALWSATPAVARWARGWMGRLPRPVLTSAACFTEAGYLLREPRPVADLLDGGDYAVACLENEAGPLAALLRKHQDAPMTPADATVVRLSELHPRATVLTVDHRHFGSIYRRHGDARIPCDFASRAGA